MSDTFALMILIRRLRREIALEEERTAIKKVRLELAQAALMRSAKVVKVNQ